MGGAEKPVTCPGCGLQMPVGPTASYNGYYNTSPECWEVYTEVLGAEFSNAIIFGQVHQLTVDTYAVQHAGGPHPDKSISVHLTGLYLVLDREIAPMRAPSYLQSLASQVEYWPHYTPPTHSGGMTVIDVALSDSPMTHIENVRVWAAIVWEAWYPYHREIASFADQYLKDYRK
jgi:hypothetical protein